MKKRYTKLELEQLLDGVKDEIDEAITGVLGRKSRAEAARDLVEYLELHYIDASAA